MEPQSGSSGEKHTFRYIPVRAFGIDGSPMPQGLHRAFDSKTKRMRTFRDLIVDILPDKDPEKGD